MAEQLDMLQAALRLENRPVPVFPNVRLIQIATACDRIGTQITTALEGQQRVRGVTLACKIRRKERERAS